VGEPAVDFRTEPARYRHWRIEVDGRVATLVLGVDEAGGLQPGYELKLNSYDLGVDIELADAVQRLRFEHPEVAAVVVASDRDRVFSAGANIRMLAAASHGWKVNFCKFTNETRIAIEEAGSASGQRYLAAIGGTASGGGYELALACDHILLVDDGSSAVSLPEVPLLGVLPGTGGLTRVVDKRGVRRDLADAFVTRAEGVRGETALAWGLVDELAPRSRFADAVRARAEALASASDRPAAGPGVTLDAIEREVEADRIRYRWVTAELDRDRGVVDLTVSGPAAGEAATGEELLAAGSGSWALGAARQLDDLVLHLRTNEPALGTWVLRTTGDHDAMRALDAGLAAGHGHWLVREVVLLWKRTLKRLDMTSRSLLAVIEPGSCFVGTLLELALVADRSYMLDDDGTAVEATAMNAGPYPMGNGLTRLACRGVAHAPVGQRLSARGAEAARMVTFARDAIDWDDEVRMAIEERASFSPDALTAMEANLRFAGPETLETKVFGRLSAWQNWVFQRPAALDILRAYGTGTRATFDPRRV
jgi:benzoyl-CoA-dihydrodiol lyase